MSYKLQKLVPTYWNSTICEVGKIFASYVNSMSELKLAGNWKLVLQVTRITRVTTYKRENDLRSKPSPHPMNDLLEPTPHLSAPPLFTIKPGRVVLLL